MCAWSKKRPMRPTKKKASAEDLDEALACQKGPGGRRWATKPLVELLATGTCGAYLAPLGVYLGSWRLEEIIISFVASVCLCGVLGLWDSGAPKARMKVLETRHKSYVHQRPESTTPACNSAQE